MAIVVPVSTVVNEVSPSGFRSDEFGPPGGNTTIQHNYTYSYHYLAASYN